MLYFWGVGLVWMITWEGGGYMRNFYKVLTNGIVGHMGYIPLFWLTKIDVRWCGFTRSVSGFFYSPQTPP